MLERNFQASQIKELKKEFPDALIYKMDAQYKQGTPDILILNKKRWAALEVKKDEKASHRPNQDYYITKMNEMSNASFVDPSNKREVIDELRKTFGTRRSACISRTK